MLIVVTNVAKYKGADLPTGLWLSELTHIYYHAKQLGVEVTIASPKGGKCPVDPESLKPFVLDGLSRQYLADQDFRELLDHTKSLGDVVEKPFDCVYLAGGHGTMYDFPEDINIQNIVRKQYEGNRLVAAICHGVGGLLNARLSGGNYLIAGKKITGFDWFEETIARRKNRVPFNLEAALKSRNVYYKKAFIPMTSNVVADGNLITGQNPFSSKEMAKTVLQHMIRFPRNT